MLLQSDSENGDSDNAGDDNDDDDDYESESGDETADESDSGDDSMTTTAMAASSDGASSAVNSSTPAVPTPQWHPVSASDLPADQPLFAGLSGTQVRQNDNMEPIDFFSTVC